MIETAGCPACGGRRATPAAENATHTINTGRRVFVSHIRNVLCETCGLIYNDPMPDRRELSELYEALARDIADRPPESTRILPIERDQAAFLWPYLSGVPTPRVLDVGSSMGGFLAAVAGLGAQVVGVEPSPHDSAIARTRFNLDVRAGFFEQIEFGDERFDAVALRFVFEHVHDPRGVLRRARALLTSDGVLFVDVPNLEMPFVGLDDFFSYGHLQTFTPATLAHLCALEGLVPASLEPRANLFDSSPHPPSIRCVLRGQPPGHTVAPDVLRVRSALDRYLRARAALVERVRTRVCETTAECRRVVLYGAGTHTAELWQACPELAERVIGFVDGNRKLQGHAFLGRPVSSPTALASLQPDRIVISARTAEPQIASFLQSEGFGSITVRLYDHAGVAAA